MTEENRIYVWELKGLNRRIAQSLSLDSSAPLTLGERIIMNVSGKFEELYSFPLALKILAAAETNPRLSKFIPEEDTLRLSLSQFALRYASEIAENSTSSLEALENQMAIVALYAIDVLKQRPPQSSGDLR